MINKDTILSAFDDKGTLLKWLKKVEKALKENILSCVEVIKITDTRAVIKFTFEDNTSITTPEFLLPEGAREPKGLKTLSINSMGLQIGITLFDCVYNGTYYKQLSLNQVFTGEENIKALFFCFSFIPSPDTYIKYVNIPINNFNGDTELSTDIHLVSHIISECFLLTDNIVIIIDAENE